MIRHKHILVIDDEEDMRLVIQACLEEIVGWEVSLAASAQHGLVQFLQATPDAVLLDVMMPNMDGVEFLKSLRLYVENQSIPVVFLTAKSDFIYLEDFSNLGVKGIIQKPFDPLHLADQISNLLDWDLLDA